MIALQRVLVAPYGSGGPTDISCLIGDVSINHGRSDTSGQPSPSSATFNLTMDPDTPIPGPEILDVGSYITVSVTAGTGTYARFHGRITDISIGWEDNGEETGEVAVGQIVAVSRLADYARAILPPTVFISGEMDGLRVAEVFALAGLTIVNSDPGVYRVYAEDYRGKSVLSVVQKIAESAGGLVWHTTASEIRYADANHRYQSTVEMELDACDILVTPTWSRSLMGLVNEISMTWGNDLIGAGVYTASDAASVAKYGRYAYSTDTVLEQEGYASLAAEQILDLNSDPVWVVSSLPIDVASLTVAETETLLRLDVNSYIHVTGFPDTGTTPTAMYVYVEGWTEKLAWGTHDLELYVSDQHRTTPTGPVIGPTTSAKLPSGRKDPATAVDVTV